MAKTVTRDEMNAVSLGIESHVGLGRGGVRREDVGGENRKAGDGKDRGFGFAEIRAGEGTAELQLVRKALLARRLEEPGPR